LELRQEIGAITTSMAATNKCLARGNKSSAALNATDKRDTRPVPIPLDVSNETNSENKVTAPQIAFLMRAYPNYNLDHLSELSFEFDQAGKIIDCIGTIKAGGNVGHDYAGGGLARLYETARRKLADRKTSATVLQFPNGAIK
jgi:hypothetical protein